jgi:branched-chain amino acid transport system permease protein
VLAQQLINGLMLGSTYALVAIGYALIFGVLRLLHLAHGEVYMVGAFAGISLVLWFSVGPLTALIGGLVVASLIGMLLELIAFRPIRRRRGSYLAPIVSSVGAGLVLQELVTKLYGAEQVSFPRQFESAVYYIVTIPITGTQIFIVAVAFVSMFALHLFVGYTRVGAAMRATSENIEIASILGINVDNIVLLSFGIASGLGGIAGVLVGLNFNSVSPFMGINMSIKGFAVMLIGGLGSIYGAMAGGLILGVVEVLSVAYLASSYRDAFVFFLMILILLVRPRGLFSAGIEAGH